MALKPTIYKARIALSDLDSDLYRQLSLTLAQHPSETVERMLVRLLAYLLNVQAEPQFGRGVSSTSEPDIFSTDETQQLRLWIDVGEPAVERIKKATRLAQAVKVYSFNAKSNVWWGQQQNQLQQLPVSIYQFEWQSVTQLATLLERTMDMTVMVSGNSVYITTSQGESRLECRTLFQPAEGKPG